MSCCIAIAAVIAGVGWFFRPRQSTQAQNWRLHP